MITDADIKKLKAVFATKEDLNKFATKENIQELKNRIDILEDNVTGEIAKLHDENLITSTYRGRIENHENRITTLENTS